MRRRFRAPDGRTWEATVISRGHTSSYLNPRVHRPIVEFRPLDSGAIRYAPLPGGATELGALDDDALLQLFGDAASH